ncbi:MAG: tail fiber domain-containing protein [Bacteroidetes bacterium]|nr:tail fiber domain-containing protein [Bacteroidota bacterium]
MKTSTQLNFTNQLLSFLTITFLLCVYTTNVNAQAGPNYAVYVVNETSAGTLAWTNSANAAGAIDDNVWAETPGMALNDESQYLYAFNFGFAIPAFHNIDGIEIKVEGHQNLNGIRDVEVFLVLAGVIQTGDNQAAGLNLPAGPPDGMTTYGGSSYLWSQTLTKADIEDPGFGVAYRVKKVGTGPPGTYKAFIDRISITVYHSMIMVDNDPTNELNTSLTLTGTTLEITDAGGTLSQDLSSITNASEIFDADNDTKIQVEESADEDIIRFDLAGTERWVMQGAGLEPMNSGRSVFIGEDAGANDDLSTNQNVFIGYQAGKANTTGFRNTFSGYQAGQANTTGQSNTFLGYLSGFSNTSGFNNTFSGYQTGFSNTTGVQNVFSGNRVGFHNTTGSWNTFSGFVTGFNNSTGNFNTFSGSGAGQSNTTGSSNTSSGYQAGFSNTSGSGNVFLGREAGYSETGSNTLYIDNSNTTTPLIHGDFATNALTVNGSLMVGNLSGSGNRMVIANASGSLSTQTIPVNTDNQDLSSSSSGTNRTINITGGAGTTFNVADNDDSPTNELQTISKSGSTVTLSGGGGSFTDAVNDADASPTNELNSAASLVGTDLKITDAGGTLTVDLSSLGGGSTDEISDADNDTKIQVEESADEDIIRFDLAGTEQWVMKGGRLEPGDGGSSIFIGREAGINDDLSNNGNVFIGTEAGHSSILGSQCVFIGNKAGRSQTGGGANIFIGSSAGLNNISGNLNTFIGSGSGKFNTTGFENTFIGNITGFSNTSGNNNTFSGVFAGSETTTGSKNTFTGSRSAKNNHTGEMNTFSGYQSGYFNEIGNNNTFTGFRAGYSNISGLNNTAFGYNAGLQGTVWTNRTAIGYNTQNTASNQVRIGNSAVTSIGGYANWTNISDARLKKDVQEDVAGLDFIMKLRPVTYHLDMDAIASHLNTPDSLRLIDSEALKGNIVQTGFIAQEVEKAALALEYDFSGVDAPKNDDDMYGLRYAEFVVPLVKAMQEQQAQIQELKALNQAVSINEDELNKLREENDAIKAKAEEQEEQIRVMQEALLAIGYCCDKNASPNGTGSIDQNGTHSMQLDQNRPNPFEKMTNLSYQLEKRGFVDLSIYNENSTFVTALVSENQDAGGFSIDWDARDQAPGVYVYILKQDNEILSRTMVLVK